MKNIFLTFLMLTLYQQLNAQTEQQIDSIAERMCNSFEFNKMDVNDYKYRAVYQRHLRSFLTIINVDTQKEANEVNGRVYSRLKKNCNIFFDAYNFYEGIKTDWMIVREKPVNKLTTEQCAKFFEGEKYFYLDMGKVVKVTLTSNSWKEIMEDGSYSKLILRSKKNGEFELEFVENNNEFKKKKYKKGRLFHYGIYDLQDGIYYFWAEDENDIFTCKFYTTIP